MKPIIIVGISDDGQVGIQGPIQDKVFCYGLLEMAKDMVRNFQPPTIEKPQLVTANFVPNIPTPK